jgi:hypothetical protein
VDDDDDDDRIILCSCRSLFRLFYEGGRKVRYHRILLLSLLLTKVMGCEKIERFY